MQSYGALYKKTSRALILGVGNILMKDDGAGVMAVEHIKKNYALPRTVKCLDGGTAGVGLLLYIKRYSDIIIIDAVRTKGKAGIVRRITPLDIKKGPDKAKTAHYLGIKEFLALARFAGIRPSSIAIIGIKPKDTSFGTELTPVVRKKLPYIAGAVKKELGRLGYKILKKDARV